MRVRFNCDKRTHTHQLWQIIFAEIWHKRAKHTFIIIVSTCMFSLCLYICCIMCVLSFFFRFVESTWGICLTTLNFAFFNAYSGRKKKRARITLLFGFFMFTVCCTHFFLLISFLFCSLLHFAFLLLAVYFSLLVLFHFIRFDSTTILF